MIFFEKNVQSALTDPIPYIIEEGEKPIARDLSPSLNLHYATIYVVVVDAFALVAP